MNDRLLILFVGILSLSVINGQYDKKPTTINTSPNIILIVADDLGYADIGATKLVDDVNTPNIDRIVNSGIRFAQAYDNSPICNQSRIGIITGCYPQRLGSYWYGAKGLHDPMYKTIPEILKQQNYVSGYVGKTH